MKNKSFRKRIITTITAITLILGIFTSCEKSVPPEIGDTQTNFDLSNTELIGLDVDNFCLSSVESSVMSDRLMYSAVHDFFQCKPPRAFAFVRVLEIEQKGDDDTVSGTIQTSTVQVLSTIWDNGDDLPQVISVNQYHHGVGVSDNYNSIFLRKGGVYLLPLNHSIWEDSDSWSVMGDEDVLFEVDDNGIIWSHSPYRGFSQYNGKEVNEVAALITDLLEDDNFSIASSKFGQYMRWDYDLVDVKIVSEEKVQTQFGTSTDIYTKYTMISPTKGEFSAVSREDDYFVADNRYLVLIWDDGCDGEMIGKGKSTKINNDGTIAGDDGAFSELKGYTVERVLEEAENAKKWWSTRKIKPH